MYLMSEYALQRIKGRSFETPMQLLENILDDVYDYGVKITGNAHLRKTFALNALVPVDNTAWLLYAAENNIHSFDDLVPKFCKPALSQHHDKIASIPLMAYSIPVDEIVAAVEDGYFFMKIKIGHPGSPEEMLEKDKSRISEIHDAIGSYRTPYTASGKLPYYFDANGRYENKEQLKRLIDHLDHIDALEQVAIVEEPFPEEYEEPVGNLPVRIAADESAHTVDDARKRIELGYSAIALKAIAKTLSMTMQVAQLAYDQHIPCFCADLTVNPILVDWNKNVAARLTAFPGLDNLGLLETNGHQNYANWPAMQQHHPFADAEWTKPKNGVFELSADFYEKNGGMFKESEYYQMLLD
jgi:L-alanine-DL-glutamate epimerase-like enolase superfamily enzyme